MYEIQYASQKAVSTIRSGITSFEYFITRHQIRDEKECLRRIMEYPNKITLYLVYGFHTESSLIRYLHSTV